MKAIKYEEPWKVRRDLPYAPEPVGVPHRKTNLAPPDQKPAILNGRPILCSDAVHTQGLESLQHMREQNVPPKASFLYTP